MAILAQSRIKINRTPLQVENNCSVSRKIFCAELKLCNNSNRDVCVLSVDGHSCKRNYFLPDISVLVYFIVSVVILIFHPCLLSRL